MSKYERLWVYLGGCDKAKINLTFAEIGQIAGMPVDHSFLRYKKELTEYGYAVGRISLKEQRIEFDRIPKHKVLVLYLHGKGGNAEEAERFKPLFSDCDVVGLDYKANTPWEAKKELSAVFCRLSAHYERVILVATSIGAYFAMCALSREKIEKAYFISPVVNMEQLIVDMMVRANVSERDLREKETVETAFGETLSWKYLCYVRSHPVGWSVPTEILYGERDCLVSLETISSFAAARRIGLTVMPNGEHWFHTAEQTAFLEDWLRADLQRSNANEFRS